jgi:hypothetical protein
MKYVSWTQYVGFRTGMVINLRDGGQIVQVWGSDGWDSIRISPDGMVSDLITGEAR